MLRNAHFARSLTHFRAPVNYQMSQNDLVLCHSAPPRETSTGSVPSTKCRPRPPSLFPFSRHPREMTSRSDHRYHAHLFVEKVDLPRTQPRLHIRTHATLARTGLCVCARVCVSTPEIAVTSARAPVTRAGDNPVGALVRIGARRRHPRACACPRSHLFYHGQDSGGHRFRQK